VRILILEDDTEFSELLQMDLEGSGHQVDLCETGTEAFDKLEDAPYDLLIADIYIWREGSVRTDGGLLVTGRMSALRLSDKTDPRAAMKIIVMSGAVSRPGQSHILEVAATMGADAVLAKPFSSDDLHRTINRLMPDQAS
tara:strand:+ start:126 stop:545 length:420 start_codon:yes stop_codon:yes gene_type:complete